jgi:hypothetical protein
MVSELFTMSALKRRFAKPSVFFAFYYSSPPFLPSALYRRDFWQITEANGRRKLASHGKLWKKFR